MNYKDINEKYWNKKVEEEYIWTQAVSKEEVDRARDGEWNIVLTPKRHVPRGWFPEELEGVKILCLASGGGQQGPILAAAGAEVTVLDYSVEQLKKDRMVAERDGLNIATIKGDMSDLSVFEDCTFDIIVHPWSNCFIQDVNPVWREAYRVLKKGGRLMAGFANPIEYIFDYNRLCSGEFCVRHSIPYSDLTSLSEEEFKELIEVDGEGVVFGHSLEDQIGGQLKAGFLLSGFLEDIGSTGMLDKYIKSSVMTMSIKY